MPTRDATPLSYHDALRRLLSVTSSPRLGLARMERLLAALGDPQRGFRALHVAGTNGKGSVCAMLDAMLREGGARVGVTTSPHLTSARERIVIDGVPVDEDLFVALEARVAAAAATMGDDPPTFFERVIAMAFMAFCDARVDVAVVEVGLGGRLDATSTCVPLVSAVVSISLDHMEFLGDTEAAIAREKAGIAKPGVPLVVGPLSPEAREAVVDVAHARGAPVVMVGEGDGATVRLVGDGGHLAVTCADRVLLDDTRLALFGSHQRTNAAVAVAMLDAAGLVPALDARRRGLECVVHRGRYETVCHDPLVVVDGAHNEGGARALATALATDARMAGRAIHLVVGATRGHDPRTFARTLAASGLAPAHVIATRARAPRSLEAADIAAGYRDAFGDHVLAVLGVRDAVARACTLARGDGGVVVVTGSLYLVGEARLSFVDAPCDDVLPLF